MFDERAMNMTNICEYDVLMMICLLPYYCPEIMTCLLPLCYVMCYAMR